MALGVQGVTSKKLGEIRIPLYKAPYVANDTVSPFLINAPFGAELISIRSDFGSTLAPSNPPWSNLFLSDCSPTKRTDLMLGSGASANIDNQGTAMIGSIFATSLNDNRDGLGVKNVGAYSNFNNIGFGNTTLFQQPNFYDVSQAGGNGFANPDNLPTFVYVQISVSPPTFVPAMYFSAAGNNVIANVYERVLYHGQVVGAPILLWAGPSIPGGGTGTNGIILPETFTLDQTRGLAYSDSTLHSASISGNLPDGINKTNGMILFDGTIWRILSWLPGEFPLGSGVYNQNGLDTHVTLDDATLNSVFQGSNGQLEQCWFKGFLFKLKTTYKNSTPVLMVLTPDGTGYYIVIPVPMDATAQAVMSTGVDTKFALAANGVLYANQFNSTNIASSFGVNPFTLNVPTINPVTMSCFEPCLPYPVSYPGGLE